MPARLGRSQAPDRMPRDGFRAVGVVERPRGLKGELKALPLTDFPERFDPGAQIYIAGEPRTVARSQWHKGRVFLFLDGVADQAAAETLRGELIEVPELDRPPGQDSFWYIDEIEGLQVRTADGDDLGAVREVLQTGANDVYIVDRAPQRDLLVPALRDVVLEIDIEAGTMTVDLPEGLLPV